MSQDWKVTLRALKRWFHCATVWMVLVGQASFAQAPSFSVSHLDFAGLASVSLGTSLEFGPDGRLYVLQLDGTILVLTIEWLGPSRYVVVDATVLLHVKEIPNHDDDGSGHSTMGREATGITVAGTASHPVVYVSSSDDRVGGPTGDVDLDTNSGVLTRITWQGVDVEDPHGYWHAVDIVRGLPRSEENHATNGLAWVRIGSDDFLLVAQGGHTNAGSPSKNFAWQTEYALSAAILAVNLTQLEAMPIQNDGARDFVYDLPTVDDPTRLNANGIDDPYDQDYDGIDVGDPWGGNDGLNQARVVPGGPVQIFSPGYRNAYDLVVTEGGAVYVSDNGANVGWGGFPEKEGLGGDTTNDYRPGEPGSNDTDPEYDDAKVNNQDHLTLITLDVETYEFGSFYGGHPNPIRSNPAGAGLFTRGIHSSDPGDSNGNGYEDDWFRTVPYDPRASGEASDPRRALPADWPPVPVAMANPVEGDFRNPCGPNPDGPDDDCVAAWRNNANGFVEYTASSSGGVMHGDLIAGRSGGGGGSLHRVQVEPDGSLRTLTENWVTNLGGNPLGVAVNGDEDPFPGTIWVATFDSKVVVLEPQDFVFCIFPGESTYDPFGDYDADGYTNQDEDDNGSDLCNGGSQPGDFDKSAGGTLVSDRNDLDDDADGIDDAHDVLQLGDPLRGGSDAFSLPVRNELFSDNLELGGYRGLGLTGMMNSGAPNPNWLQWIDRPDAGPNPNDVLGGAVGAMTMQMTAGTAVGSANDQEKGFQYGADVDLMTGGFHVESRMLNFGAGHQLYSFPGSGELGIFIGDGTQSHFIQFVVSREGVEVLQETDDVPELMLGAAIDAADRPASSLTFRLEVDSASGRVEALYSVDGGPMKSLGFFFARGKILEAIQQSGVPIIVGLIGSSHTPGAEVEGTWDYLNVIGRQPTVERPLADISEPVGGSLYLSFDLDEFFADDDGDAGLTYSIVSLTDPSVVAEIDASILRLALPDFAASSTLTIRATDGSGLYVEQTFSVSVTAVALFRVNAGGPEVAAIDGGVPWEEDSESRPSQYLVDPGSNHSAIFSMTGYGPGVDLATTPTAIYSSERWDQGSGPPRITYAFPVPAGRYQVRLYMGNGWPRAAMPGHRIFSVEIEGEAFEDLTDLDLSATFGHQIGGAVSHVVDVSDGILEIELFHGAANNPMVNGIEILTGSFGPPPASVVSWIDKDEDEGYTGRHECAFVQAGDKFYLFGGRENPRVVDTYDYTANAWTASAPAPFAFNHFQAVEYQGLVWVLGAFATNDFPHEVPADHVWVFDPAVDAWTRGPEIPASRRRGSAGLALHGGKLYLVGGNTDGHSGGYVPWFDELDPETGAWVPLADAPRPRDHFHAVVLDDSLYVAGGRLSGGPGGAAESLVPEVDVYDFTTGSWSTLPAGGNLPSPRAGAATAVFDERILVIGGEGNGRAYDTVEALDPSSGSWETLASLNHARHGTQAIVSGAGVFITAGSPIQGGGHQKNMEVYGADLPAGVASVAGVLSLSSSGDFQDEAPVSVLLEHAGGNQGIYLTAVSISGPDAADFVVSPSFPSPFLLPVGEARELVVSYLGDSPAASASLDLTTAGDRVTSIGLEVVPASPGP